MSDAAIRDFSEQDVEKLTELMRKLCEITQIAFDPTRWQKSVRQQFQEADISHFFVAELEGIAIGMAFATVRRAASGERFGYIANLIVDSKFRGHRIGERLIQSAIDFFRQNHLESVRVAVRKESPEALHLLKKAGFSEKITILEQKI